MRTPGESAIADGVGRRFAGGFATEEMEESRSYSRLFRKRSAPTINRIPYDRAPRRDGARRSGGISGRVSYRRLADDGAFARLPR